MASAYTGESIFLSSDYEDDDGVFHAVREAKFSEKTVLYLQRLTVTSTLASSIIELIGEEQPNRPWTKLVVCECPDNLDLHRVLAVAVRHFANVVLSDIKLPDETLMGAVSCGLTMETSPTRLELREISLNARQMSVLARGLGWSSSLETLRFGAINLKHDTQTISRLARGLRANRSILKLQMTRCEIMDEQLAIVVESLIGHPSINALDVSGNRCRGFGLRSLSDYLARSDCRLVTLKLGDQFYKRLPVASSTSSTSSERSQRFPVEELLPGLQANHSLRHLDLSRNQLSDVTPILTILWYCPHIQTLDLLGNRLTNFEALAGRRFVHQTRPSRLRRLELGYNCLWNKQQQHEAGKEEAAQWLVILLEDHPELECFARTVSQSLWARPKASGGPCLSTKLIGPLTLRGWPILSSPLLFWKETSQSPKIQHLLDLNKTGRVLVANNRVPLAVWPRVLDRANRLLADDKVRQATAVFHLLRGPMTIER